LNTLSFPHQILVCVFWTCSER